MEAGKKAAAAVLDLQARILGALGASPQAADQIAAKVGGDAEAVYMLLEHLAANGRAKSSGGAPGAAQFSRV